MNQIFSAMTESLHDPAKVHAMMVHFPAAISVIGLVLLFLLTVSGGRSAGMRWACIVVYLIGAGVSFAAHISGENAAGQLDTNNFTNAAFETLNEHSEAGEKVWIPLAVTTVFVALTAINVTGLRVLMLVGAFLAAIASFAWVSYAAHLGGNLVYTHGVGVPSSQNNQPPIEVKEPTPPPKPAASAPSTAPAKSHSGEATTQPASHEATTAPAEAVVNPDEHTSENPH